MGVNSRRKNDTVILSDSEHGLELRRMDKILGTKYPMKINESKTKIMAVNIWN